MPNPTSIPAERGLSDNAAGMLAYIAVVPAIVLLSMEPYKKRRFVRFHCFQSIFFGLATVAISVIVSLLGTIAAFGLFELLFLIVVVLGVVMLWLIVVVKAYQGEEFRLPLIGEMAEKQAGD